LSRTLEATRKFLGEEGFEILDLGTAFSFVAQDHSVLVFVAEADSDLNAAAMRALNALSLPFRVKRFGPKTMEMYCVLVADQAFPLPEIEKWEQDIRVCRKIVVTGDASVTERLSFLRPVLEAVKNVTDIDELFWAELRKYLSEEETLFLRALGDRPLQPDEALNLLRRHQ
jgi:hypothetical protein